MSTIDEKVARIAKDHPLVKQAGAGRLFSLVKRMKAEVEANIPVHRRTGAVLAAAPGKKAATMNAHEWEQMFSKTTHQLKREYPELAARALSEDDADDEREFRRFHGMSKD